MFSAHRPSFHNCNKDRRTGKSKLMFVEVYRLEKSALLLSYFLLSKPYCYLLGHLLTCCNVIHIFFFINSKFLRGNDKDRHRVLLIQCERGDENQQLLQCAQYKLQKMWSEIAQPKHHAVFIVQLPRVSSAAFSGFMVSTITKQHTA